MNNLRTLSIFKARITITLVLAILIMLFFAGCGTSSQGSGGGKPLSKGQWEIQTSELDDSIKVALNEISESEISNYQTGSFELYGNPIHLTANDQDNVRLPESISVTVDLPSDLLDQLKSETITLDALFFGYFYNGIWEPYFPTNVNLEAGTATFEVYHFSILGFGSPTEAEQLDRYAESMATKAWMKDEEYSAYAAATKDEFDNMFTEMGIKSKETRNQLIADVLSYVDESDIGYLDFMAQSVKSGASGSDANLDFENKYKEFLGKALYNVIQKDPGKFSSKVNVIGNLASAAGALSGGDERAAMESIANIINGALPVAQLATSTAKFVTASMQASIDYWSQSELDKAYQVYKTGVGGKWGYEDGLQGDFETIFTLLGGSDRELDRKVIAKYCERRGMDPNTLSDDQRQNIINDAKASLKANFDQRIVSEDAISKYKSDELSFLNEVKKAGLLNASSYMTYFGIDKGYGNYSIEERLLRLEHVKSLVKGIMDDDIAANMDDATLVKVMSQWLYWSEKKDKESFYKYMRELGYIKEPLKMDGGVWTIKEVIRNTNEAGWAAADAHEVYSFKQSYSEGSYGLVWTYDGESDDYYDPPYVHGESYAVQAVHDIPPTTLTPGEEISLNIGISVTADSLSAYYPSGSIRAWFNGQNMTTSDGNHFFSVSDEVPAMNGVISALIPEGSEDATLEIEFDFFAGETLSTTYVYEFKP